MANRPKILVTGGCGYIGSHVCSQLSQMAYQVIVLDNLSTGYAENLLQGETLIHGDFGDRELVRKLFTEHEIDTVIHFAASIVVEESIQKPFSYYENNSIKFFHFLQEINSARVPRFILSSTAAVYGIPEENIPLKETDRLAPIQPYGRSKLFDEWLLQDCAKISGLQYLILRYFNVAGAANNGKLGQRGRGTHLIKILCETALGLREKIQIYGTDYETPDGSCIRDYIHVDDLASAHIAVLDYLERGGSPLILNCGYKEGFSVKEVIHHFIELTGKKIKVSESLRRAGDAPYLVADHSLLLEKLSWKAHNNDLEKIIVSAWEWEQKANRVI